MLLLSILVLLIELGLLVLAASLLIFSFWGAPYVPSRPRHVGLILQALQMEKGKVFLDLGCGDGYVVCQATKNYGVRGRGIDINPLLITYARLSARLSKLKNLVDFKTQNALQAKIDSADYIYLYLLPALLEKLKNKLEQEAKPGAVIVSNGFRIKDWDQYLDHTLATGKNSAYFYRPRR